jgi:hypothetical protein
MNLRTLFAIPIAVVLLVTLSLAGMMAGQGWSEQTRAREAVEAVARMRLLLDLQNDLRSERTVTNLALGKAHPLPEPISVRLIETRRRTDQSIAAIAAEITARGSDEHDALAGHYIVSIRVLLGRARASIDEMLALDQAARGYDDLATAMPGLLAVSHKLDAPMERASIAVADADPSLSGLVILERLGVSLRDQVGLIAEILLPRFNAGQAPSADEVDRVRVALARTAYLTRLIDDTMQVVVPTERMRGALIDLKATDLAAFARQIDTASRWPDSVDGDIKRLMPQSILVPWGERINALRAGISELMVRRVTLSQAAGEERFDLILAGVGAVMVALLESVILMTQRVVKPLAHLGQAITRIAAGDRGVPVVANSSSRELHEMEVAVETLRQAALVADAAALHQRMVARHRLELLREALGIVQTVQEPAHTLERGVASLSEGIDAAIAMVSSEHSGQPATLTTAAEAVRTGLAEMRAFAAELDATFAAANEAQTEDRPPEELVAHIRAVAAEVDRRDHAVRGFAQVSLVALRDAAATTPAVRLLVNDQFEQIEATVATVASMRDAVTRASAIVRELPLEVAPLAA